ncbi:MAG TPA: hypothetical protein VHW60_20590 [Caulobacteraceae bacterium]|jgi:hypothetical protein|nr:hypothetical protein [Caulobacteraceae bacterium]
MSRYTIFTLLALALLAPTAASAEATATLTLRGFVPVICRANFESAPSEGANGVEQLGSIDEFCNSGAGYQVIVDYDPGASSSGTLVVDGRQVVLDGSGSVVIDQSTGPAISSKSLGYIPGDQPISNLHIRVVPA